MYSFFFRATRCVVFYYANNARYFNVLLKTWISEVGFLPLGVASVPRTISHHRLRRTLDVLILYKYVFRCLG